MQERDRDPPAPPSAPDGDGVRITRHGPGRRREWSYLALALALVGAGAGYLWTRIDGVSSVRDDLARAPGASAGTQSTLHADPADDPADPGAIRAAPRPGSTHESDPPDPPPGPDELARYVPAGEVPTMKDVIEGLHEAGIRTGLGAFNPPGTSPPLIGLAVPEDFPLPEGYVRHYQATDDGQRIEPILMFSPDFVFHDADGRPIAIPENRVVPPELAPPGLAIRPIVIPPPRDPTPGRPSI
ncbi:MAG: hypothetical protein ACOY82_11980 [Pseudomonadota bacterium]